MPVDLELGPDRPLVVITGPNAGGKTIALKTLALLVLMAQSGLHVPAAEGSRLPVFTRVHAIIGDDQSVAENLSTFSAFVKQVREILAEAGPQSLVLLDELGAGTDPDAAPVMTGSHIDTVRTGGRYDGNLGVLAGLEVIETLEQHGVATRHPVSVAFFTDEEGARFAPDMLGSLVYVGGMALEEALDVTAVDDGARLGDELLRIGYAGPLPCPAAAAPAAPIARNASRRDSLRFLVSLFSFMFFLPYWV